MGNTHGRLRRAFGAGAVVFLAAAAGFTVAAGPAQAVGTDWYVSTDGNDSNGCTSGSDPCATIAEVVDRANNDDVVHVAGGTYAESEIEIYYNLTIVGASNGTTTVSDDGDEIFDVYEDEAAPTVTFENLNISGNATGDGVYAENADVNFVDSHVDDNHYGVEAYNAAIKATGSTFSGNGDDGYYADGLYLDCGALTADHSTFDGNSGAGIWVDAYECFSNTDNVRAHAASGADVSLLLDHSTVSNNGDAGVGGYDAAIQVWSSTLSANTGAGLENESGTAGPNGAVAEVRNSTITGTKPWPTRSDAAEAAAEVEPAGGILSESFNNDLSTTRAGRSHRVTSAKLSRAHPDVAGAHSAKLATRIAAITPPSDLDPNEVAVSGSIVAEQQTGVPDCAVSDKFIVDDGYNLSSDAGNSCGFSDGSNDLVSTDPLLGALADNGGPTLTQLLAKGSPAIDAIDADNAGCTDDATDQRDLGRVQPVGGNCDMGAVELAAEPLVIHPNSLPDGTVGEDYSAQLSATGGQYPSYEFNLAPGSELPSGLSMDTDGAITGTPTEAGTFHFTVSVNDPVLKDYTIVITAPTTAPPTTPVVTPPSSGPIANTGANVAPLSVTGMLAIAAGLLLLVAAGWIGVRPGRHRGH